MDFASKHVVVGTAGHIDHGKSALVEALTGTNPDRLEEEKRRGITIDLGFAFLELDEVRLGFVDVPGHERFVRNMLAGVGGIDLVLLVVAADESIKPQTREHFDICRLLAIPRGLTVLTKLDLVDADTLVLVRLEVEEYLRGSFLEGAPIVEVSAKTGQGLDRLKQELLRVARTVPAREASRHFRLPVDRAFAMKGFGTVVTGTLVSGSVRAEDEVQLFPSKRLVRVRGVHSAGRAVEQATAGQRTALNLAGVQLSEVARGMVLASPGRFEPTRRLDARVQLLSSARPLKNRARVHFHQGTAEVVAEIVLLEAEALAPGARCLAQLRLARPVLVLPGDRFILRQLSPAVTIGGGVVLDSLAPHHRLKETPSVLAFLKILEQGQKEDVLAALVEAEPNGLPVHAVLARTAWLESELRQAATRLVEAGRLRILADGSHLVAGERMQSLVRQAHEEIEQFHRANPLLEGVSREELRSRIAPTAPAELFRALLDELVATGQVTTVGELIKRAGREIALLPEEERAKQQIEQAFARAGLAVPALREVLDKLPVEPARAEKLLQLLLRKHRLVRVSEGLVFHRSAIARLKELLAAYKQQQGDRLPIAAFKDLTGVSRKYAIPLLEYLDREGITRRVGDERVIL